MVMTGERQKTGQKPARSGVPTEEPSADQPERGFAPRGNGRPLACEAAAKPIVQDCGACGYRNASVERVSSCPDCGQPMVVELDPYGPESRDRA